MVGPVEDKFQDTSADPIMLRSRQIKNDTDDVLSMEVRLFFIKDGDVVSVMSDDLPQEVMRKGMNEMLFLPARWQGDPCLPQFQQPRR